MDITSMDIDIQIEAQTDEKKSLIKDMTETVEDFEKHAIQLIENLCRDVRMDISRISEEFDYSSALLIREKKILGSKLDRVVELDKLLSAFQGVQNTTTLKQNVYDYTTTSGMTTEKDNSDNVMVPESLQVG